MRYAFSLTIPASTPLATPAIRTVNLDFGRLKRCIVYFHDGCFNHVFGTASASLFQIVPAHGTEALFGNDKSYDIPLDFPLLDPPYEITLKGWSPDTRYPHTLNYWFDLEQDEEAVKDAFLKWLTSVQSSEVET